MAEILLQTPSELGALIRERRKALEVTQTELAGLSGVGTRFIVELERGKPTVELGKVLRVLERLGIRIVARDDRDST